MDYIRDLGTRIGDRVAELPRLPLVFVVCVVCISVLVVFYTQSHNQGLREVALGFAAIAALVLIYMIVRGVMKEVGVSVLLLLAGVVLVGLFGIAFTAPMGPGLGTRPD